MAVGELAFPIATGIGHGQTYWGRGMFEKIDDATRNAVNKDFFYNPYLEGLIDYLNYTPSRRAPGVPISGTTQEYLETLRRDGVVIIPGLLPDVADAVNAAYFEPMEGKRKADKDLLYQDKIARFEASGTQRVKVSYRDPIVQPLLWNDEICGLLYNYYQRQPYYRDQCMAILSSPESEVGNRVEYSAKYHLDLFHQITVQFLVNDLTPNDTRLQYAVGSHKEKRFSSDRYIFTEEEVEQRYDILNCVGPKGTVIIMDAGAGLHRGTYVPGSVRKTLHTIVQAGHAMNTFGKIDTVEGWAAYKGFPRFMQKKMDKMDKSRL